MNTTDVADLNAQYNNRALVADSARILQSWADRSAQVREAFGGDARLDLRYGRGRNETVDVFPTDHDHAPIVIFIHGGYWRALDKSDHSFIVPALHSQGAHVVVPNYALCPAVRIGDIALQMVKLVLWVQSHAKQWQADAKRIVLIGHSAGAHLAAMLLACQWKSLGCAMPPVRKALGLSGVYDLRPLVGLPLLQDDLRLTEPEAAKLSPARWPAPRSVEFHALAGSSESAAFRWQNRAIQHAWGAAVPVCEQAAGLDHFTIVNHLAEEGSRVHRAACGLMTG
jgi:arylformamidase